MFSHLSDACASASLLDRHLQMVFIVCYFGMIVDLDDMLPPLCSQIKRIALTVLHSPAFARTRHVVTLQYHEIIVQLAWLFCSLSPPPSTPESTASVARAMRQAALALEQRALWARRAANAMITPGYHKRHAKARQR